MSNPHLAIALLEQGNRNLRDHLAFSQYREGKTKAKLAQALEEVERLRAECQRLHGKPSPKGAA